MQKNATIAIAVVAILAVAGAATAIVVLNKDDGATYNEGAYNILARVNAEGSGLYIKTSVVDSYNGDIPVRNGVQFYSIVDGKVVVNESNKAAWAGLTYGTPGATSIQHIQLCTLADQMGLTMRSVASEDKGDASKSMYYNDKIINYQTAVEVKNKIEAGIVWEPQYAKIVATPGYTKLALTNDLFPGHTCCTIIGNHTYINNNEDTTVRFLAGYVDAVKFIQTALAKDSTGNYVNSAQYNELVQICVNNTTGLSESEIKAALSTITYLYADGTDGNLDKLTDDIKALASSLSDLGATTKSTNAGKLADALVDDSYLKKAVDYTYSGSEEKGIRVAVIDGDIHQIAIRVAMAKGYFSAYKINVTVSTGLSNGGAVADALIGGQADFGFIGAPPATLKTINSPLISV